MDGTIKWSELTPLQRNRLVGERVMGDTYTCDVVPDFTTHQNPSRAGGIAFSYTTWLCPACGATGYYGKEALVAHEKPAPIPNYTTSLDAAWLLIEHIVDQKNEATVKLAQWEEHEMCFWCMRKDELCNEICLATLEACGVEVEQ